MACVNLVHSRTDIFDSNHWRKQEVIELHRTLKEKIPLIHDALCLSTKWTKNKMSNISHFKSPFQACTWQPHVNDDAIYAWKNIELWIGDKWIAQVEEVNVMHLHSLPTQLHMSHSEKPSGQYLGLACDE
jgi:hypothetical protein